MTVGLHWFLPTSGDGRSLVESGEARRSAEIDRPSRRQVVTNAPSLDHLESVARAAEEAGFDEQRRFGDRLDKDGRYARTDEFLTVLRGASQGAPFDIHGEHVWVEGALAPLAERPPEVWFGGSSDAAVRVAARHADVYLTWGIPPPAAKEHVERVRAEAGEQGRSPRFGIRLHVVARSTAEEAWRAADALIAGADVVAAQRVLASLQSVGQSRITALHGGRLDQLEVYPNLWAGIGLARARRWSDDTTRSRTGSRSITPRGSTSSSCPAGRTRRRPAVSARRSSPSYGRWGWREGVVRARTAPTRA